MDKQYYGWAIRLPYEYDAMAGVLFWTSPPPHCAAIRTAVFETRREAREAKKRCPAGSKVVHVKVAISETAMSSNVEFNGTPAALSPEAPLERRVGGAVPPAPTFGDKHGT